MGLNIDEVIDDAYILREGYIFRDGFVFVPSQHHPCIMNRLLLRNPSRARGILNLRGYSWKTFDEHIQFINEYQLQKALLICDDLRFIQNCPSLTDVVVEVPYSAKDHYDFSPLYGLPDLRALHCRTGYDDHSGVMFSIDYAKLPSLKKLVMTDDGYPMFQAHQNFEELCLLEHLCISGNKNKSYSSVSSLNHGSSLRHLKLSGCSIETLNGLSNHPYMESLELSDCRSLSDIDDLGAVASTLRILYIESCPRVKDLSVLSKLKNLEHLELMGNNIISDLMFLENMHQLKSFMFSMNVANGDLTPCLCVPYVSSRNRKHYNLRDCQLPKNRSQDNSL